MVELAVDNVEKLIVGDAKGNLTDADRVNLRIKCVEMAILIASSKGKPSHAPYIAADLYKFLLTGEKPEGPDERKARAVKEKAEAATPQS